MSALGLRSITDVSVLLRGRALAEFGHVEQARSDLSVVERLSPNRVADLKAAMARAEEVEKREKQEKAGGKPGEK